MNDAIRHLDQRFKALTALAAAPPKGWVRAVRNDLGMTTKQLAIRLGVTQQRITELEKAELSGRLTLNALERAAEALGCRLVYALIPERPLKETVTRQAEHIADKRLANIQQTMGLENQSVRSPAQKDIRRQLILDLLQKPARLWDEHE